MTRKNKQKKIQKNKEQKVEKNINNSFTEIKCDVHALEYSN